MSIADLFRIICCLVRYAVIIITLYYLSNVIIGHTKHNRSINNLIFTYKRVGLRGIVYVYFGLLPDSGSNNFCCNINMHRITLYGENIPYQYILTILETKPVIMVIVPIS